MSRKRRQVLATAFNGTIRLFHNGLLTVMLMLIFGVAGWFLAGVSGMLLSWIVKANAHKDLGEWFLRDFPNLGKVVGAIGGLLFAWWMFKPGAEQAKMIGLISTPESESGPESDSGDDAPR